MTIAPSCLEPAQVTCPPALPIRCGGHCEFTLNIGIFFDGTGNNRVEDKGPDGKKQAQSNVARLFDAYREDPMKGYFRHYIAGVGTPCKELGTSGKDPREAAAGKGGQARILVGLLQVLNSVHAFINNTRPMFSDKQMTALCSEHRVRPDDPSRDISWREEERVLKEFGLTSGLLDDKEACIRFFSGQAKKLKQQLHARNQPIEIIAIYLDVFGFSRGAAQARTFTTWLHQYLLHDASASTAGELFGVKSYVRMLGIFDTVVSVGLANTKDNNHKNWGSPENLHIHPAVKNCVHFAAMHELRSSFPFDSVCGKDGAMPSNCCERYYPGAHSDVGGGYAPGEHGKGVSVTPGIYDPPPLPQKDNRKKLSQLPLNDMLQAARKTCETHPHNPWLEFESAAGKKNLLTEQFDIDALVHRSVVTYFSKCGIPENLSIDEALRRHGELYLAWRHKVTKANNFENLTSIGHARRFDPENVKYLLEGESIFATQLKFVATPDLPDYEVNNGKRRMSRRAADIMASIKTMTVVPEISHFFDDYVHDSFAGFLNVGTLVQSISEHEGYLRHRIVYSGDEVPQNAALGVSQQTRMA